MGICIDVSLSVLVFLFNSKTDSSRYQIAITNEKNTRKILDRIFQTFWYFFYQLFYFTCYMQADQWTLCHYKLKVACSELNFVMAKCSSDLCDFYAITRLVWCAKTVLKYHQWKYLISFNPVRIFWNKQLNCVQNPSCS